jgi:hypothetical protein
MDGFRCLLIIRDELGFINRVDDLVIGDREYNQYPKMISFAAMNWNSCRRPNTSKH